MAGRLRAGLEKEGAQSKAKKREEGGEMMGLAFKSKNQ